MKTTQSEKRESLACLRKLCARGQTVYTVLRHVSSSGMSRRIDLYVIRKNQPRRITWSVGRVLGYSEGKHDGLTVSGCGMDMGFHLVNSLSYALHGSKNHDAEGNRKSGYTLEHRWL